VKHNIPITVLLLSMFVVAQLIGIYVINSNPLENNPFLSYMQPPEIQQESDFGIYLGSIIFSFIFAIAILFFLTKFKVDFILKAWFFLVVSLAIFISLNSVIPKSLYFIIPAILVALTLSFIKIFRRNFMIHNLTELLIYPGIATIFVPILNFWSILVLLLLISIYDLWAVWHSGIMQKMAKYQINKLKVFSGFFVPYISKKLRMQLNKMKKLKKNNKKIKVNVAILGGGDIVFPIITAGVIFKTTSINLPFGFVFNGGLTPALFVVGGATLGLGLLFLFSKKKKFYPAMPFITAGILFGLILSCILGI